MVEIPNDRNEESHPILYSLLLLISCLWMLHTWQQRKRFYKLGNMLPGPPALPFVGHALLALGTTNKDIVEMALSYADKYGTVIRAWMGPKLYVFLCDPHDIEVLLNSQVHIDKSDEYSLFKPWLGDGLLISSGFKWHEHRKMIAPTFHINILKSFLEVFNQNSKKIVEKMRSEVGDGNTFDIHDYMSEVTVDILLETAMGINKITTAMGINKITHDKSGFDYARAVMKMCDIIHQRHYKFYLRFEPFFKWTALFKKQKQLLNIIHGLTNEVIKIKKKIYLDNKAKGVIPKTLEELTRPNDTHNDNLLDNSDKSLSDLAFKGHRDDLDYIDENDVGEKKRLAFLDLMIESAQNKTNKITDQEIKEEVDTIMFEGHDTTAAGSSFTLCLLGIYQDIQAKVYDELYEIYGDSDRRVTYTDTLRMKYLERVILETLRLYPPVPGIARKLNEEVKIETNGYILPAGCTVVLCTYRAHRNSKYYEDPETFNPDNFLPENTQNRHYYSYIPFSAGPRSCVGRKYALLKLKVLLATILRNFKCVSDVTEDQFKLTVDIILKRADGFRLRIEPRIRVPSPV